MYVGCLHYVLFMQASLKARVPGFLFSLKAGCVDASHCSALPMPAKQTTAAKQTNGVKAVLHTEVPIVCHP